MKIKFKIGRDRNGNKLLTVKVDDRRAFTLQTRNNLLRGQNATQEELDSDFYMRNLVLAEVCSFVSVYGSKGQKETELYVQEQKNAARTLTEANAEIQRLKKALADKEEEFNDFVKETKENNLYA